MAQSVRDAITARMGYSGNTYAPSAAVVAVAASVTSPSTKLDRMSGKKRPRKPPKPKLTREELALLPARVPEYMRRAKNIAQSYGKGYGGQQY